MSPASIPFILLVLLAAPMYAITPHSYRKIILLVISLTFYGSFNVGFLFLLLAVIGVSYFGGILAEQNKENVWFKNISILLILSPLLFYKYILVWLDSLLTVIPISTLDFGGYGSVLIPVGLSFFTFQCLGYLIDVYRGAVKPERNITNFTLFVAFFPQLLAGPIERYSNLSGQILASKRPSPDMVINGLVFLSYGLFLKVCLADRLSGYVDAIYSDPVNNASASVLLGMYGFTFQLYGDFFGYSMIAIGSAMLFGIKLSKNFEQPFFTRNIGEFWQHWHMTLTRWIGDYIYRPLVSWSMKQKNWGRMTKESSVQGITWVIMGLWHGANLTFIIFGIVQGAFILLHKALLPNIRRHKGVFITALSIFLTFHFVVLTFALIRADSLSSYITLAEVMLSFSRGLLIDGDVFFYGFISLSIVLLVDLIMKYWPDNKLLSSVTSRMFVIGILLVLVVLIGNDDGRAFIYFRF